MSIDFQVEETINVPVEIVFRASTDLDAARKWMPGYVGIKRLTGPGFEPGTRWRETRKMYGREATEEFEVKEVVPNERIELYVDGSKGSSRKGYYRFWFHFKPGNATAAQDPATHVIMRGEIGGMGKVGELIGKLMVKPFRNACAKDLAAMKAHLENR